MLLIIVRDLKQTGLLVAQRDAVAATNTKALVLKIIKYWLPVIIYAILIFQVSDTPGKKIPYLFPHQDIIAHMLEYAGFALLIKRAIKSYYPGLKIGKTFVLVLFLSILYAFTDELHQSFVPGRDSSFLDITYDGIGICLANLFYK